MKELVYSDTIVELAQSVAAEHAARIHERIPEVEVCHSGGSSVPGVLTADPQVAHPRSGGDRRAEPAEQAPDLGLHRAVVE